MNAINTPQLGELARSTVADFNGIRDAADLDAARVIGTEVVLRYGTDDAASFARICDHGIWSDHPAVQGALVAIRICRHVLAVAPQATAAAAPIPIAPTIGWNDFVDEAKAPVDPLAEAADRLAQLFAETPTPWRADPADNDPDAETIEIWDAAGQYIAEIDLREYTRERDGTTIGHQVAALIVETMNGQLVATPAAETLDEEPFGADETPDVEAAHAEQRAAFEALGAALPWRTTGIVDGVLISATRRAVATVHVVDSLDDPREAALATLIANAVNTAAGFPPAASS